MHDRDRQRQWRGLRELLDDAEYVAVAAQEFPPGADLPPSREAQGDLSRRHFLSLLGASMALAGGAGCSRAPRHEIVPYVSDPPEVTPSIARYYASSLTLDGYAFGVLVESHEGRPTKIEGHPEHPSTRGAASTWMQASVLGLYDPNRAKGVLRDGIPASWAAFAAAMSTPVPAGKEIHIVLEPTSSPLVGEWLDALGRDRPEVRVHFYSPIARTRTWESTRRAFGRPLQPLFDVRAANVIVALDSDFLCGATEPLVHARDFADGRKLKTPDERMNRLYVVEPSMTVTGMSADHRRRAKARDIHAIAASLLQAVRGAHVDDPWVAAVARDLAAHRGASLVVAGHTQPVDVHVLVHAINDALGNHGTTVRFIEPPTLDPVAQSRGVGDLARAVDEGRVQRVIVLGGNPVYATTGQLDLAALLRRVPASAYLGPHRNETAQACQWVVAEAHALEAWGDARAHDGTVSLVQPLVEPIYGGRTVTEVLAALHGGAGEANATAHALLTASWRAKAPRSQPFDDFFREAIRRGVVDGTASPVVATTLDPRAADVALASVSNDAGGAVEIVLREDARVVDGRFTNNAWLLELADPVTKLTWDNAAIVSPATAKRLALASEDMVRVVANGKTVEAPVLIVPGQCDDSIALSIGYGRSGDEELARGVGANAFSLRGAATTWFFGGSLEKTGRSYPLALTQEHWRMEGREIVMRRTLDEYKREPVFTREKKELRPSLYQLDPKRRASNQWAMTIDVNACTGCSACVVACMSENNIPVVGKGGVLKSREMHWLRIDRYYEGPQDNPEALTQPMLCQQCEKAPCEYVCPVNAAVHSDDGLNEQVYNRCVGTRFCSNNCPYKVRRFNWFNYTREQPSPVDLQRNPDVTVRERGVMEKCTFCVQRIRETEIKARREHRPIKDGEIKTACQQTCPTGAITFGSITDHDSEVSKQRAIGRSYRVLDDLGTSPRVTYLAKIKNKNPEVVDT